MRRSEIVPIEHVGSLIRIVRGQKVILDEDLARLYAVETRILNRAVNRHLDRFPADFMFQLTLNEYKNLISQFGISSSEVAGHGGRRKSPLAFTEQGVAMLSSVLNSPRAIQVNITTKMKNHDKQFEIVFEAIGQLMSPKHKSKNRPIGFGQDKD